MPTEIIVKTQKELDAIKPDFNGTVYIEGGTWSSPLKISVKFNTAYVIVRGEAYVVARGSSHVEAWESSHVEAWESSHVVARGSSHVEAWGSSHVVARGSSHHKLFGEAMVHAFSAKEIVCAGYNVISVSKSNKKGMKIVTNKTSVVHVVPDFKPTFEEFAKRYPVEVKGKTAILYKAVHKVKDKYLSDYDRSFAYKIGETIEHDCDQSKDYSCSKGLHISEKAWAKSFGATWQDMALLECEVAIKDIVVGKDCDGKVRTNKLKVLREVPKEEW